MPVIAVRTRLSPVAASLARPGSRSGPKMNSAASARTMISPHPIESNTAAPVVRDRPRGHPSLDRQARRRPGRVAPLVSGLVQGGLELPRAAVTDDLDGDRVARVVGVDRDDEFLGAADRLALDPDDDVLLLEPSGGGGAARLHVEHQGPVARAVGD